MTSKEYALIVAGGRGTRFNSAVPKQFAELGGKPVLIRTLQAFFDYSPEITIVLVLPERDLGTWAPLAKQYGFDAKLILQTGGATRFESVRNGLGRIPHDGYVAIHDGVRPLVRPETIRTSFDLARVHGCAVAAVRLKESLRVAAEESSRQDDTIWQGTRAVDRSRYRIIQTPQTFRTDLIKKAYAIDDDPSLTDDASVAERSGVPVVLFESDFENIKITTPEDLAVATALLQRREP